MALKAIITAGGLVPRDLQPLTTASRKALIELGGRTLLETALTATDGCALVDDVVVVGNAEVEAALAGRAAFIAEGESLIDNIQRGFSHFDDLRADYLVLSPDLPFLTSAELSSFISTARRHCELGVPTVGRDTFLAAYPGSPNRFEHIGGRALTMGSCFYFTGPALKTNIPLARDCYRYRKYPHRLALMLGPRIVCAFIFRRLTLEMLEQRASQLTGVTTRTIELAEAAIAYDIDNRANYDYAVEWLRRRPA
ncbi:NTP transferase domain-containing protein [bacterium]|nr:NTP transferase domain-containing protein [bacterium]